MGRTGLEPVTNGLRVRCSTIELTTRACGIVRTGIWGVKDCGSEIPASFE